MGNRTGLLGEFEHMVLVAVLRLGSVTADGFEAVRESRAAFMDLWKGLETRFEEP